MCCSRIRICRQENEDKNYTNQHAAMRMHADMSVYMSILGSVAKDDDRYSSHGTGLLRACVRLNRMERSPRREILRRGRPLKREPCAL